MLLHKFRKNNFVSVTSYEMQASAIIVFFFALLFDL
jgi:hypothetical protein